jgi:hypothetical protein
MFAVAHQAASNHRREPTDMHLIALNCASMRVDYPIVSRKSHVEITSQIRGFALPEATTTWFFSPQVNRKNQIP